jgi:hypothetical protein
MTTRPEIRQAVAALIEGTGLRLDDTDPEAVMIFNPAQPDRGTVLISTEAGCVSRVQHEYFGHLEGFTTGHSDSPQCQSRPVPGPLIIHLLTGPATGPREETGSQ